MKYLILKNKVLLFILSNYNVDFSGLRFVNVFFCKQQPVFFIRQRRDLRRNLKEHNEVVLWLFIRSSPSSQHGRKHFGN